MLLWRPVHLSGALLVGQRRALYLAAPTPHPPRDIYHQLCIPLTRLRTILRLTDHSVEH